MDGNYGSLFLLLFSYKFNTAGNELLLLDLSDLLFEMMENGVIDPVVHISPNVGEVFFGAPILPSATSDELKMRPKLDKNRS